MANKSRKTKPKKKSLKKYNVVMRPFVRFWRFICEWFLRQKKRHQEFMERRPQRSFKLSKKRDVSRSMKMPGYFAFAHEVWSTIWKNKGLFIKFILLFAVISAVVTGTLSQSSYTALRDSVMEVSEGLGVNEMISLVGGVVTASSDEDATMSSQIIAGLLMLFGWLAIVWILRYRKAGKDIRLRDALYNCGAPILATFALLLIMVLQLMPFALALLAYTSASGIGLINWSVDIENMAAWCVLAAVAVLTLYWMVTSFIALVIVTNPGTYPWTAIRIAGDKVVGRRARILLRLLFMMLPIVLLWLVALVPMIMLDNALRIDWLPLVPYTSLLLSTLTIVWVASYIYLLYRYLLEDDAPPVVGMKRTKTSKQSKKLKKK